MEMILRSYALPKDYGILMETPTICLSKHFESFTSFKPYTVAH